VTLSGSATVSGRNAGTYTGWSTNGLSVDNGNYTLTDGTVSVAITPKALTVKANDASKVYDGQSWSGGNGVSYDGFVTGEDSSVLAGELIYGGTSQGAKNAQTYKITPDGLKSGNYEITFADGNLTITPKALTITGSRVYNGSAAFGTGDLALAGIVADDTVTLSGSATVSGRNAGTYTGWSTNGLSVDNGNYTLTDGTVSVRILPKAISLDGSKSADGNVNFVASTFGDNGIVAGIGSETLTLTGAGTVAFADVTEARQSLSTGNLALNDGANGGLGINYTLEGGTHYGTIKNNEVPSDPTQNETASSVPTVTIQIDTQIMSNSQFMNSAFVSTGVSMMPINPAPPVITVGNYTLEPYTAPNNDEQ
jgi:hypothetical protein